MKSRFLKMQAEKENRETAKWTFFNLMLIIGVSSVPLMTDYVLEGSDVQASLARIEAVKQGIGNFFPVRTGVWPVQDCGYGAVSFQADVFYLIPAVLRLLGVGLGPAYRLSLFLGNLFTALIAFRCFEKCFGRWEIAMAGSMLYTWCPCRLDELYVNGNLGNIAAWTFLPVIMSAIVRLYTTDSEKEEYDSLWVPFTWGFSLLVLSSTSIFFATAGMLGIIFLFMGKRSIRKKIILILGKAAAVSFLVNAWFLIPMLLRMQNAENVQMLLPQDFQALGIYFVQYLSVFQWGGREDVLFENGLAGTRAAGPGIVVVLLVIFRFAALFTGRYEKEGKTSFFEKRMLWVCLALIFLSSGSFPWDLFRDRNMLCSILTALLQTPAKWAVSACICLIAAACAALGQAARQEEEKRFRILLLAVTAVSVGTTQFFTGNILKTGVFAGPEESAMEMMPFPLVTEESMIWRLCEIISAVTLCGCLTISIMRRRKRVEKM